MRGYPDLPPNRICPKCGSWNGYWRCTKCHPLSPAEQLELARQASAHARRAIGR